MPCLPPTLLSFVLCRAHVRRDSWGVKGIAARSTLSKREVMSKSRGTRRTSQQEYPKWCYLLCDSFLFEGNLSLVKLWVIHDLAEWNECFVSSCSPEMLCSNQFLPKSHSHLFCLYIHCCIFGSPRSGVEYYNLSYLQCCHWECQGILWCSTCLNFRGNKYKIPLGTIKTSGFNNAELVLSLNDSLSVGIAPQSFSEVACLIFLSVLLQKCRSKSMIVFLCVLVAPLHPRKR